MLGKLLKYEFRATGRVFLPMYAILIVMSLIARIFYSPRDSIGVSETAVTAIVTLIMVMLFTAVWVVTLVLILRRFWQNLLGREGYLMNVLPAAPWEHVAGKLIVAVVWYLLSAVVSVLAFLLMLWRVLHLMDIDWSEMFTMLGHAWSELLAEGAGVQAGLMIALLLLDCLVSVAAFVLSTYAAMSVGQLVSKARVWLSIGVYFGINTVVSVISTVYMTLRLRLAESGSAGFGLFGPSLFGFGSARTGGGLSEGISALNTELVIYLASYLALCALLFFFTRTILKKRLNLQ